jgi:hypothetical protein
MTVFKFVQGDVRNETRSAIMDGMSNKDVRAWVGIACADARVTLSYVIEQRQLLKHAGWQPPPRVKRGIGFVAKKLLRAGLGTEQVIAGVKDQFPNSAINTLHVASYRCRVGKEDNIRDGQRRKSARG